MKRTTVLAIIAATCGVIVAQAQTWVGAGDRIWTQPDTDDFSATYNSGAAVTFGATGAGTVTVDGTVTPGLKTFSGGPYVFEGGTIGGTGGLTKGPAGDVTFSNVNTYSGVTFINSAGGKLEFRGKQSVPPSTLFRALCNGTSGTRFLMDDAGTVDLGNTLQPYGGDSIANQTNFYNIFVGSESGTVSDKTIVLGMVDFVGGGGHTSQMKAISISGADGYRLQVGDVRMNWNHSPTSDRGPQTFYPITAPVTITGTVKQNNGNTGNTTANRLHLVGPLETATNYITGVIKDADDYDDASNPNAQPLRVAVNEVTDNSYNKSLWAFSNTNTYSGGTRMRGTGTLSANATGALGTGDVTILTTTAKLIMNAENAMGKTATLALQSATVETLEMNATCEIAALTLAGTPQPTGIYRAADYVWMGGEGVLYVGVDKPSAGTTIILK